MFQAVANYFRRAVATGILMGVDDAENALAARLATAETKLPQPTTKLLETTARRLEEPARNGKKRAR